MIGLAVVALLGRAVGEVGRDALLAYAAVLLAFLCGRSSGGATASAFPLYAVPLVGIFAPLSGLILGSFRGLLVLALAYGLLTAFTFMKTGDVLPRPLLVAAGIICTIIAARYYRA